MLRAYINVLHFVKTFVFLSCLSVFYHSIIYRFLSVHLSVCPSVSLSVHLAIVLSFCNSFYHSILSLFESVRPSICCIYLSVCRSVAFQSIYISVNFNCKCLCSVYCNYNSSSGLLPQFAFNTILVKKRHLKGILI